MAIYTAFLASVAKIRFKPFETIPVNSVKLVVYNFFKEFCNCQNNRYWWIVVWVILFPLLNIGDTLANFHSVGKTPVLIDFVNICESDGAIDYIAGHF